MGDSGSRSGRKAAQRNAEPPSAAAPQPNIASAPRRSSQQGNARREDIQAHQLLMRYGEALDSIAISPPVRQLQSHSIPVFRSKPFTFLRRVNPAATILAERYVAARVDSLLRRGHRFRAVDPGNPCSLDVKSLQDFRDSLSPTKWRTLALWVILLALALAFPMAWITDKLRTLVPKAVECSTFSIHALNVGSNSPPPGCRAHHAGGTLWNALVQVGRQLQLNPGAVVNTVVNAYKGSSPVVLLLLAADMVLSLCAVLLVFRAGFRLKRLAFSMPQRSPATEVFPSFGINGHGLYGLERDVFASAGLPCPREFPLDLVVSAGLLVLPVTIATALFKTATERNLDPRTITQLIIVALALSLAVVLRLGWLLRVWYHRIGRVWGHRIGLTAVEQRTRWLSDDTAVLVCSGVYGALLLATGVFMWAIWLSSYGLPPVGVFFLIIILAPTYAWPLNMLWWYRIHREIAAYEQLRDHPASRNSILTFYRAPAFSLVFPVALACSVILGIPMLYKDNFPPSSGVRDLIVTILLTSLWLVPVSVGRMAWKLERLQYDGDPDSAFKPTRKVLSALGCFFFLPGAVIPYLQRSLNLIWRKTAAVTPWPPR